MEPVYVPSSVLSSLPQSSPLKSGAGYWERKSCQNSSLGISILNGFLDCVYSIQFLLRLKQSYKDSIFQTHFLSMNNRIHHLQYFWAMVKRICSKGRPWTWRGVLSPTPTSSSSLSPPSQEEEEGIDLVQSHTHQLECGNHRPLFSFTSCYAQPPVLQHGKL